MSFRLSVQIKECSVCTNSNKLSNKLCFHCSFLHNRAHKLYAAYSVLLTNILLLTTNRNCRLSSHKCTKQIFNIYVSLFCDDNVIVAVEC